ncbi:MAG: DUF4352 domain-containing protein [Oscillospiraceae bacterium]|nr:DUF4352 domain-containing protein [Oscillospiraceae bacterium]
MKKNLMIVVVFVLLLALFYGCGSADDTQSKQESRNEQYSLNDTAEFDNIKLIATEIKTTKGSEYFIPASVNKFVGVRFIIENTSNRKQKINTSLLFDSYADDVKLDYSFEAGAAFGENTLDGDISSGKSFKGFYGVEVPQNAGILRIEIKPERLSTSSAVYQFDIPE